MPSLKTQQAPTSASAGGRGVLPCVFRMSAKAVMVLPRPWAVIKTKQLTDLRPTEENAFKPLTSHLLVHRERRNIICCPKKSALEAIHTLDLRCC